MPITLGQNEVTNQHLYCQFQQDWTWHEFHQTVKKINEAGRDSAQPVNIIFDLSNSAKPPSFSDMNPVQRQPFKAACVPGLFVFVGPLAYAQSVMFNFQRTYHLGELFFISESRTTAERIVNHSVSAAV